MNCPSRNDEEPPEHEGWNQNPSALAADLTTREDMNGVCNRRTNQDSGTKAEDDRAESHTDSPAEYCRILDAPANSRQALKDTTNTDLGNRDSTLDATTQTAFSVPGHRRRSHRQSQSYESFPELDIADTRDTATSQESPSRRSITTPSRAPGFTRRIVQIFRKFLGFIGPGFMVAVAYIDPGNYSTDVSAGVATRFKLLFIVLMSNIFAIVLQSLAIRLGTVTGMNLAEHCRAHLPRWLNICLYLLGEAAIIATDIAEVRLLWRPVSRRSKLINF